MSLYKHKLTLLFMIDMMDPAIREKVMQKKSTKKAVHEPLKKSTKKSTRVVSKYTSGTAAGTSQKSSAERYVKVMPKKESKSISIDPQVYKSLLKLRAGMSNKMAGKITFNMVIQSLLQDSFDLINMKSELLTLKSEMDETQDYLKEMLKLALEKPQPQYIPIAGAPQIISGPIQPPPPPMAPQIAPPRAPPKAYIAPDTGDLKKDYVAEISQVFNGEIRKPSEIAKITQPKHINAEIKELDKEQIEKVAVNIFEKSTAKNFPKPDIGSDV